ncbi:MAG: PD-(D/E)XK nuclease family protein [Chloroflexi bacterium]|nr:PD-(D/E)XK nuclease family protein [Chloroflexota bacterium]
MTNTISQSTIRDFLTCRYLYLLKHKRGLVPATEDSAEGSERQVAARRGQQFHRAAQQYFSGLDSDSVQSTIQDSAVRAWFEQFVDRGIIGVPDNRSVEAWVTAPLADRVLVARYDLIAWDSDRLVICDWKTGSRPSEDPRTQIQTIVYRYVAARGARAATGVAYAPDQIEVRYWYVRDSAPVLQIAYSQEEFERDKAHLEALIAEVASCTDFPKTENLEACGACLYRAVCRPDVPARAWLPDDDDSLVPDDAGWSEL